MASGTSVHQLDMVLAKFDTFLEQAATVHSTLTSSQFAGIIYAFFPSKTPESTARSDVCALRTCFIVSYLRYWLRLYGKKFFKESSSFDRFFALMKSELDWTFSDESGDGGTVDTSRYERILRKKAATVSGNQTFGDQSCSDIDQEIFQIPIMDNDQISLEAAEAARIASLLYSDNAGTDSDQQQDLNRYLIVLIPEDHCRIWNRVRRLLEWLLATDQRTVHISAVTVGRVTFANDWALSVIDYIKRRRSLIGDSYRHKHSASGSDESNAPLATRRALTLTSICFELLGPSIRRSVTIEEVGYRGVGNDREVISPQWARNGIFVMYNYARLSNILEKYNQGVIEARYPALVSLDSLGDGIKSKIAQEMGSLIDWLHGFIGCSDFRFDIGELESKLPNPRNDMFQLSGQFSTFYSKRRVLTDSVSIKGQNADALVAKIHVLSRLKRLYLLWFEMLSITGVEMM